MCFVRVHDDMHQMQSTFRFDVVRSDRLRYLSHFSGAHEQTKSYSGSFLAYSDASDTASRGMCRIRMEYLKDDFGRYHVSHDKYDGLCLQRMNKVVRNWLVGDTAQDIDIVNAAPTVVCELLRSHGLTGLSLSHFVSHYDECMKELRDAGFKDAKKVKNWMLFGPGECGPSYPSWVAGLRAELQSMMPQLRSHYETVYAKAVASNDQKREEAAQRPSRRRRTDSGIQASAYEENVTGLFYNYLYQLHEGKLLRAMDDAGRDSGLWGQEVSLIHDGMLVYPSRVLLAADLMRLSDIMRDKTGIHVQLQFKPIKTTIDIDIKSFPNPIVLARHGGHLAASRIALLALEGCYIRDNSCSYATENGVWLRGKEDVDNFLLRRVQNLNFWRQTYNAIKEEWTDVPFTEDTAHARKVVTSIKSMKERTVIDFPKDVVMKGIRKLAYSNGFYEFLHTPVRGVHGRFVDGGIFDTFHRIESLFPMRVQDDVDFVMNNIIDPIFSNTEAGMKGLFLTAVARALAGDMDKTTYIIYGPRNSGKSVLFQFLENAFCHYVRTIPTTVFACGDGAGSEAFRQTGWMAEAELARIIKMSELPPSRDSKNKVKIDGSKIKAFQSMKEGIMARALYCNQRMHYSLGTGFFLMNDVPEFLPVDSMERCHFFEFPNEFVSVEAKREDWANANKMVAKPEIEEIIQQERYKAAFTHIILEAYKPSPIVPLESMIHMKEEAMTGQGDDMYLTVVEVTRSSQDSIMLDDLKTELEKAGIRDNSTAMGYAMKRIITAEFKLHGQEVPDKIKKRGTNRNVRGYNKTFYHYVKLRTQYDGTCGGVSNANSNHVSSASAGYETEKGSYATGFFPGRGN